MGAAVSSEDFKAQQLVTRWIELDVVTRDTIILDGPADQLVISGDEPRPNRVALAPDMRPVECCSL